VNKSFPEIAMVSTSPSPEISDALTVVPEVVYSPTVPVTFATNKSLPDIAIPVAPPAPAEISDALTVAPEVMYSPTLLFQ
jgi:hypothetical protein